MPSNAIERLLLAVFAGFALVILFGAGLNIASNATSIENIVSMLVAVLFALAIAVAYKFPIHVRHRIKANMNLVPLYLVTVLLPWQFAAPSALIGTALGNLLVRKQQDLFLSDVAISAGRRMVVVFFASLLGHSSIFTNNFDNNLLLALVAVFMLFGEMLTFSLQAVPVLREPLGHIIAYYLREISPSEIVQYLIGILGALAAAQGFWALILLALPTVLAYLAFKSSKEMHDGTRQILEGMADAVDLRDPYTGGHSRRVAEMCARILKELNTPGVEADLVVMAARVHDIGKLGIADEILFKPEALAVGEAKIMQSHVEQGARLLMRYPDFARGADIVRHHHERWDGKGYPDSLQGLAIPFGARVLMVADSFDAMTTDRPYRRGMSPEQALAVLRSGSEKQWDSEVVEALARIVLHDAQSLPLQKLSPSVAPS